MFDLLEDADKVIGKLIDIDPDECADTELADAVMAIARLRCRLEAAEAKVIAVWDRRRVWAIDGSKSAGAWMAHRTRLPQSECWATIRLARATVDLALAGDTWAKGEISAAHVRVLDRARNERTVEDMARDEEMLVDDARALSFAHS